MQVNFLLFTKLIFADLLVVVFGWIELIIFNFSFDLQVSKLNLFSITFFRWLEICALRHSFFYKFSNLAYFKDCFDAKVEM